MKNLAQVFLGFVIALVAVGLLLASGLISLAEGKITNTSTSTLTQTLTPTSSPTWQVLTASTDSPTPPPTRTPTGTSTLPPPPTNCPSPAGWLPYIVQDGDTLNNLATRDRTSSAELQQDNCLVTTELIPGVFLYLPPVLTETPVPCGQPYAWTVYRVLPGDTLYHLSQIYGITVAELQRANCLGSSTLLHTGQILYVPPWEPIILYPTIVGTAIPFSTATDTPEPGPPSDTPTPFLTNTPSNTFVPVPSDTPMEVPTDTPPDAAP